MSETTLVAITKPVGLLKVETAEELISYIARVSNPKNQKNFSTAGKLLNFCIRNQHWSIFEMVHLAIEIKTTRDIGRQILRHRSFSFQEFSQRYAVVNTDDFVIRETRLQDPKNRQNSVELDDDMTMIRVEWERQQKLAATAAEEAYSWAINNGIAKEQARVVLPEGMTPSVMYMSGSLRSWIHYCRLRMGNGTQKEHTVIARQCYDILRNEFSFLDEVTA